MKVVCYQLAAAPGTLRLWIGAHPATTVPRVDGWRIDGADVRPANLVVVRRMQSVRQGRLPPGDRPRAFSGVYDITGVAGPAYPKLEVRVDGRLFERTLRSLPRRLEIDGPGLNVLLVSCFHYSTDGGLYGELLPRIVRGSAAADLCVFMGDQVYLDLPTLQNFPDDPGWLADKFEQDYVRNWFFGSFAGGLQLAPMAFVPDDHEYWNNFPHPSPFIQNSLSGSGRDNWGAAARGCFEGFQLGHGGLGAALDFDVEPVSFLMLDSRSWRNAELTRLLSDEASTQLNAWADRVAGSSGLVAGVIVTGQSLIENPVGAVKGAVGDYALANYPAPYAAILGALTRVVESGKPVLLLTGDVHWGRVTSVRDRRRDVVALHEVIASPASLVATVGADQVADAIGAVKRWVGATDPWPRHAESAAPPSHLPHSGQRFRTGAWTGYRGNQCVMLRLARRGFGVSVEYTFHPFARSGVSPLTGRLELQPIG
jgi:hypothetical protein